MKSQKSIGILLILGAIGVFIPYTILTIIFEYPDILRQDSGAILTKFHEGGTQLILTWWAFAILGMPLIIAYIQIGELLSSKLRFLKWVTTIGIIGLVVQMLGLLRWVFVVPVLANTFVSGNEMTKEACKVAFQVVHQYGGVVLGEHVGQIFTIIWTIGISYAIFKLRVLPNWTAWLGYMSSMIYLLAQTELFETVIPNFPVIEWAGFVGSTLWLFWLISVGAYLTLRPVFLATQGEATVDDEVANGSVFGGGHNGVVMLMKIVKGDEDAIYRVLSTEIMRDE